MTTVHGLHGIVVPTQTLIREPTADVSPSA